MAHATKPIMLLKIDISKKDKELFDQVQVDIQGVKVDDPTAFIAVRFTNKTTGAMSSDSLLPVTEIEKYATEEHSEPNPSVPEQNPIATDGNKGNAGKSPKKPISN